MTFRTRIHRAGLALGAICAVTMLGGCFGSNKVAFTNVSDSWLNVRFYVQDPANIEYDEYGEPMNTPAFVSAKKIQIEPGETAMYSVSNSSGFHSKTQDLLVHIQIEPVTPSWQPAGYEYWLEMLTPTPVTIVASGTPENIKFNSGQGAVAIIPEHAMEDGRFEHRVVVVTDQHK